VPPSAVAVRAATADDHEVLVRALLAAMNWDPDRPAFTREAALAAPQLAHYVVGWPAPGELGTVATAAGEPIGAAWLRYLPADDPGYGFVAPDVPELSIGVAAEHRGQGVGRLLLRTLLAAARAAGVERVSLSVERANRARQLYLGEGFVVVAEDVDADTMVAMVADRPGADARGGGAGC
jgi:GNAT superfamily N-acetyltransferase